MKLNGVIASIGLAASASLSSPVMRVKEMAQIIPFEQLPFDRFVNGHVREPVVFGLTA